MATIASSAEHDAAFPVIRRIGIADLKDALAKGVEDFRVMPSLAVFLCLIYPLVGIVLACFVFGYDVLPILYPLVTGFALIGPFAAVGLYELSRRRELGLDSSWQHAFDVFRSPAKWSIFALGFLLMLIFVAWLETAQWIYAHTIGDAVPASIGALATQVFTTPAGWMLIVWGNLTGFVFALVTLTLSVVSFPMLVDRNPGATVAVLTSMRAVAANPVTMAMWGLIVAAALVAGSLPFLLGLAVVMPILGHATWHLYRKVVLSP
jgi:uncharacterized membrane protein